MEIARRLKYARDLVNKSQTQVSKDTGINNKTLSGYERGVSEPDLKTLKLLSDYYNVSLNYLLGNSDIKNPYNEERDTYTVPEEFTDPVSAREYVNRHQIFGSQGFDVDKLDDEDVVKFANELLEQMAMVSWKYRK